MALVIEHGSRLDHFQTGGFNCLSITGDGLQNGVVCPSGLGDRGLSPDSAPSEVDQLLSFRKLNSAALGSSLPLTLLLTNALSIFEPRPAP